ncbi:NadR-like protein [Coraliomargarita sinensis]|uniref:NadR-like protein n=1 Tax=Coraliomargarita sinensis TaxID=2174842 RepID=A0A317ZIG7_9BACT|nr:ATP-binding protein [Coraliomargarita sinensis]PXA05376.1 NadR-like protein [Coraliomargarita sinensis]
MIRVVITGAECTGKTTLATALSGYYGKPWTPEYVRQYVDTISRELERSDLEPIAEGQIAVEDHALELTNELVLHDTNLLSSILYANHYFGEQIDWVNEHFLSRDYTLYLLCSPEGIAWQPDPGQRDSPEARAELHRKFKESLKTLDLPYLELSGTEEARFGEAVLAIDKLLK